MDNSELQDDSVVKNYLITDYEGMDNIIMFYSHDILYMFRYRISYGEDCNLCYYAQTVYYTFMKFYTDGRKCNYL